MTVGCGADDTANDILTSVTSDGDFTVTVPNFTDPEFEIPDQTGPLYDDIESLEFEALTTGAVDGNGVFDKLMRAMKAHLRQEFEGNRISGQEYTKAYIANTNAAVSQATQWLLAKDASYWNSVNAQLQARTSAVQLVQARVALETAKAQTALIAIEAATAKAQYASTKMDLANKSVQYCISSADLANAVYRTQLLTKQVEEATARIAGISKQNILLDDEHALASAKADMLSKQITGQLNQNSYILKQIDALQQEINLGPKKLDLLQGQVDAQLAQIELLEKQVEQQEKELLLYPAKQKLLEEQAEVQRAQTLDTRSDGTTPIAGVLGQQKDLYTQQITSYQRDAEVKAAKIFMDAWITMKTLDEGLPPPTNLANTNLNEILATVKTVNNL